MQIYSHSLQYFIKFNKYLIFVSKIHLNNVNIILNSLIYNQVEFDFLLFYQFFQNVIY